MYNAHMDEQRETQLLWIGFGGLAPLFVAMVLVGVRGAMQNTNVALILVIIVVVAAVGGGRGAGTFAAAVAALSFDFFHTRPYLQLDMASRGDVETTVSLLIVGLIVAAVAATQFRTRSSGEIRRIYRVAELAARGEEASDVIMAAQAELSGLLHLRDCRFEAPPFAGSLDRLERNGATTERRHLFRKSGIELPENGVELPVLGRGHVVGRFILTPLPGIGVSLEERVVAVAVSDLVGALLADARPMNGSRRPSG